jgi:hypothetical protein
VPDAGGEGGVTDGSIDSGAGHRTAVVGEHQPRVRLLAAVSGPLIEEGLHARPVCGAQNGESSAERAHQPGDRHREFDTPVSSLDVAIPKLRSGATTRTSFSSRGGGRSRRSPRWWPPATCPGFPPGGWRGWCRPWGSTGCRSRRSASCEEPGTRRSLAFRNRPLDAGPYTYGWLERRADPSAHGVGAIRVLSRPPFTVRDPITDVDKPTRLAYRLLSGLPGRDRVGCMRWPDRDPASHMAARGSRFLTRYAMISAAGKKTRLSRKNPMKLWPFRAATRAGQNAIATQMKTIRNHRIQDMSALLDIDALRAAAVHRVPAERARRGLTR